MKTLYIMRHAKAEESFSSNKNDFDRNLLQEGIERVHKIGKELQELKTQVDLILSSPSARTKKTAEIIKDYLFYKKDIAYNGNIYEAYLNELIDTIKYTYDDINKLLIVGHNPSIGLLAYEFVGFKDEVKPSTVLKIEFDCNSWMDACKENAKFVWVKH